MKRIFFLIILGGIGIQLGTLHAGEPVKIAFLMDALQVDRWYTDRDAFKAEAEGLGAEVKIYVANSNPDKQFDQAQAAIAWGADVLVMAAANASKTGPIVSYAQEHDIPLIAYDRLVTDPGIALYISFDNCMVGRLQAKYALEAKPGGKYAIVCGPKRDFNSQLFHQGQMEILQPAIDDGQIELVYDEYMGEWAEMEGYMAATEILALHEDVAAILTANDALASGADMALMEYGLSGKVFLTGQDASLAGVQMLIDGTLGMNVYKPIKKLAKQAAQAAVQLAKGKPVPGVSQEEIKGTELPVILLDVEAVTKENYKEVVIESGHIDPAKLER